MKTKQYHESKATPTNLSGAVSKSLLFKFSQSPFKWRYGKDEREDTPALALGSLVHTLALSPQEFDETYAIAPFDSFRTKESQEWKKAQIEAGKTVITQAGYDEAREIADCLCNTNTLYTYGECDHEVIVESDIFGVPIKGMIDIAPKNGNILVDLKTCSNIESIDNITRSIIRFGYHWQAALYLDLWNATTGENRDDFHFVFIETSHPYETAIVNLSSALIQQGRTEYLRAISLWEKCIRTNHFPKAIEGIQTIELPFYLKKP